MTSVVHLDDRRQSRRFAEQECCPRHGMAALIARIRDHVDGTDGELIIDRNHLISVLHDVEDTAARLLPARGQATR
jgi:hypothetical protein